MRGSFTIMALVFTSVFVTLVTALISSSTVDFRSVNVKEARERSLSIAESALEYYRWRLAHYPNDFTNGTGNTTFTVPISDPEGGTEGEAVVTVAASGYCGATEALDITSVGHTSERADLTRSITARYARPSVAQYAYIINSDVWAGEDRVINGPYHSNGGIRMDGTANAQVTSAVSTWTCTSSFGCSGNQTQPGVFGAGASALWQFPVPRVDFAQITTDLATIKTRAQASGRYFAASGLRGYHIVFRGTQFDVYSVRRIENNIISYSTEEGYHDDETVLKHQNFIGTYTVPTACPIIFVEDKLWIDGEVSGKVTVAAADTRASEYRSVILNGSITYEDEEEDGLTLIAEDDMLITLTSPDDMELRGIFIAQGGRFGRDSYGTTGGYRTPGVFRPYIQRDSLTVYGTIVSNGREGTKWTSNGQFQSGYENRTNGYDRNLTVSPPPMTPYLSNEYQFVDWRENE